MNRVTLERLLRDRVDMIRKADRALDKLDDFCQKNWGMTFHENNGQGEDSIVEWLDYGRANVNVDYFIKFMDEQSKDKREEKLDE